MKSLTAIAKYISILSFIVVILNYSDRHQVQAHHFLFSTGLIANAKDSGNIVAIRNLQPGKIQTISGIVEALCDDKLILRDYTSPLVVNVDLEAKNIQLFQGEKLIIIGIFHHEVLEAFQIKRANGELIKLNAADENLL